MREAVPTHGRASRVQEQVIVSAVGPHREPVPEYGSCHPPERKHPLAPPLPVHMDRFQTVSEVGAHETDEFRHSEAAGISEVQHRPVSHAGDGLGIRRIENGLQLVALKVIHQRLIVWPMPARSERSRSNTSGPRLRC